jgi:SSS family solute:Na+ symporter
MAFVFVTQQLLPTGGAGIMYGVLIFSVVTAVLSGVNGVSTIFTFDIYRKFSKKQVDDKHLMKMGRLFSAVVLIIGALYTPVVGSFKHIFDFFQECWAFVAVPISLTFLFGIFSKRMSAKLAFYLLLLTFPMFLMPYVVKLLGITMNIFNVAGVVWIITFFACLLDMFLIDKTFRNQEKTLFLFEKIQVPWYKNIILWALVMVACYLTVYGLLW